MERLLKKGYEVLYLTDPVDEYCMEALPEYESMYSLVWIRGFIIFFFSITDKKFHSAAKEGLKFGDEGEAHQQQFDKLVEQFKPLTSWLQETALSGMVC